jgi:hypothetical protein
MPLGYGNLVDGDVAQVLELGLGVAATQVSLLDVLDQVPTDVQMVGHVEDGHVPGQLQGVALERLGVAAPHVGEGHLDLAHHPTVLTGHARDGKDHDSGPAADRKGAEAPLRPALGSDIARAARVTSVRPGFLPDGEDHLPTLILGSDIFVAPDAEGVIQKAGGHVDLLVGVLLNTTPIGISMSAFLQPRDASSG